MVPSPPSPYSTLAPRPHTVGALLRELRLPGACSPEPPHLRIQFHLIAGFRFLDAGLLRGQAWAIFFLFSIKPGRKERVASPHLLQESGMPAPWGQGRGMGDPTLGESALAHHGWGTG